MSELYHIETDTDSSDIMADSFAEAAQLYVQRLREYHGYTMDDGDEFRIDVSKDNIKKTFTVQFQVILNYNATEEKD